MQGPVAGAPVSRRTVNDMLAATRQMQCTAAGQPLDLVQLHWCVMMGVVRGGLKDESAGEGERERAAVLGRVGMRWTRPVVAVPPACVWARNGL